MSGYVNPLHPNPSNGQRSQFSSLGGALSPLQPSQSANVQPNRGSADPKAAASAANKRSTAHAGSRGSTNNL
ncbi:hypothetical protein EIP91_010430 [Steccherinum ochraceum]|uniref:Uncharacterized protein n=1 Tax=Steccherinum ochraceum TaxID=92696 RepID=A0A4R0R9P8_9APHY|nr:hypothetical protein EIP91_010430 [Steccherinum ochraceum]